MRRSFGGGNDGFNGGGILRSVARTVTRRTGGGSATGGSSGGDGGGLPEPFSSSSSSSKRINQNVLSLSLSSSSVNTTVPVPATANSSSLPIWPFYADDFEWVSVDHDDDEDDDDVQIGGIGSHVPSINEVQFAVSALQQTKITRDIYGAITQDWIEPSVQSYDSSSLLPHGRNRVYDAFYLLQTDSAVQKMVVSLSSDKAVWDAVMNNEVVRELKETFDTAEDYSDDDSDEDVAASGLVQWILDSTKAKATELFGTIMQLVNQLFKPYETEKAEGEEAVEIDSFEDKLRSSLLLTVMVLLVVVVG